jgi:putative DNA primase/helicase
VGATSMSDLNMDFGLQDLIDKRLSIIADARVARQASAKTIEKLLSISGGDPQQVNIKYRAPWRGYLAVRFLVLSNELPKLPDVSGALPKRFVLLMLRNTFYDNEHKQLTDKLKAELSGILNWALRGLDRLRHVKGYFEMPKRSLAAMQTLEDLASPVSAFLRDWGETGPDKKELTKDLWAAYRIWCEGEGQKPESQAEFGRNLKTVLPLLTTHARGRRRFYRGVQLSDTGREQYEHAARASLSRRESR